MADSSLVRRLAKALPGVSDDTLGERLSFSVGGKGFAWTWSERIDARGMREPRPGVLAVRCPLERKDVLIAVAPERFFDDDHYRGFPAVMIRLAAIEEAELTSLLTEAWRLVAPPSAPGAVETPGETPDDQ